MFKKIVVLILSLSFGTLMAQKSPCQINVEKELVSKIKKYSSKELIPYYSPKAEKWGYMDRQSKKVLTKAILSNPEFFNPNIMIPQLYFEKSDLNCTGIVKGSNDSYDINGIEDIRFKEPTTIWGERGDFNSDESRFVKEGISGFEVDEDKHYVYVNPKFFDTTTKKKMITYVFSHKKTYFAFVEKKDEKGRYYFMINQKGDVIKGFEHLDYYPEVTTTPSIEQTCWIWYKNKEEKYVIKDFTTGDTKIVLDSYFHPWRNTVWYIIASVDNQKGVLDLLTMEWKVPPAKENDFEKLYYSTLKDKDVTRESSVENNREDSYIYILNSKNTFYDLDMKEYKPNK